MGTLNPAASDPQQKGHDGRHEIHIEVDGEPYETQREEMTPNDIIREFAQKDPATHYLVEIKGHHKVSYEGKGDVPIKLHNNDEFMTIATGPTTVSDQNVRFGVEAFIEGLHTLGYAPATLPGKPDHVVIDYEVQTGRLAGKTVKHGFVVPHDFPMTVPSGPHVSPPIHARQGGGVHPTGGVHPSPAFEDGTGWQYWSRPCPNWATSRKTVAAYMSHIWRLWDTQ